MGKSFQKQNKTKQKKNIGAAFLIFQKQKVKKYQL